MPTLIGTIDVASTDFRAVMLTYTSYTAASTFLCTAVQCVVGPSGFPV